MAKLQSEDIILKNIYPMIVNNIEKNKSKYKLVVSRFIEKRSEYLYDTSPCDRIFFNQQDKDDFYNTLKIDPNTISKEIQKTGYYNIKRLAEDLAKDEFIIASLCIIRYFYLKNDKRDLELAMIHLAFSGRMYPSIHYNSFPKVVPSQYRHVMDYVVNNMLTNKFDLIREGSVVGAIKSICNTWLATYNSRLRKFDDDDIVYIVQQLYNRISSFMKNIAVLYYEAYGNKDVYMSYDSDSLKEDDYHLADSDSLRAERIVQNTLTKLQSSGVDYIQCKRASDTNVKTDELKTILESILSDNDNISEVTELIKLIVSIYFSNSKSKDVLTIEFLTFTITPKPNSKDRNYIRQRELLELLLQKNAVHYRKRSKRIATRNSYNSALLKYFAFMIFEANK